MATVVLRFVSKTSICMSSIFADPFHALATPIVLDSLLLVQDLAFFAIAQHVPPYSDFPPLNSRSRPSGEVRVVALTLLFVLRMPTNTVKPFPAAFSLSTFPCLFFVPYYAGSLKYALHPTSPSASSSGKQATLLSGPIQSSPFVALTAAKDLVLRHAYSARQTVPAILREISLKEQAPWFNFCPGQVLPTASDIAQRRLQRLRKHAFPSGARSAC